MKKLLGLLFLVPLLTLAQAPSLRVTNNIHLAWDEYEIGDTTNLNWSFNIYRAPTLSNSWSFWTNVPHVSITNWQTFKVWVPNDQPMQFFVVTATNVTGESPFSDPVCVRWPHPGTNLIFRN